MAPGPVPLAEHRRGRGRSRSPTSSSWSRGCARRDLVSSTRGAHGGYELSRDPAEITMAEVVQALEGIPDPDAVLRRARRHAGCCATTRWTATRTARPSCCGPASRAASPARSSRRRSPSWSQFAEHGAGAARRRRAAPAPTPPRRRPRTRQLQPNRKGEQTNGRSRDPEPARERRGQGDPQGRRPRGLPRRGARADGARTAPASRRSPTRSWATRATRSPRARSSSRART